MGIGGDIV